MKKVAVITARFDGEPHRTIPVEKISEHQIDYFYFDDTTISFSVAISPEKREDFVRNNLSKIGGLKGYDFYIWVDKKVKIISKNFVSELIAQLAITAFICSPDKEVCGYTKDVIATPAGEKTKPGEVTAGSYKIIPSVRPIIGFWHMCLIGSWRDVVDEQLSELLQYGLMDAVESIQIGVLGPKDEYEALKEKLEKYPKLHIKYYDTDITKYEFPTLTLLKAECHINEFFGFYIHTKGVSYTGHTGGIHWRRYMSFYNLEKWRDCIDRLKQGYNLCGVKLMVRPPEKEKTPGHWPTHYSGNFFHFRSEYIETCPEISTLNHKNRFDAEFWVCSGQNRNAISVCDKMIDYNVKGDYVKPQLGRTIVHTLGFNLPSEIETATKLLYKQNPDKNFEHVIVDIGFPLEAGDQIPADIEKAKQNNSLRLFRFAKEQGSLYRKTKNIGVSQNWETIRQNMNIGDSDVLICADPDERPRHDNWLKAMSEVLMHGDRIAWCSLMYIDHIPVLKDYPHKVKYVYGHKIYLMDSLLGWAQGGFNGAFLNKIGKIPVPDGAPVYGWLEHACYAKIKRYGWKWAILADFEVEHTECSPLYRAWKTQITSHVTQGQMSFEQWLKNQLTVKK